MKSFVAIAALVLASLIAMPAHSAGGACPTDPAPMTEVSGLMYAREGPGGPDDIPLVYIETNGLAGLQYGGLSAFGWSEFGDDPCKDGDQLIY